MKEKDTSAARSIGRGTLSKSGKGLEEGAKTMDQEAQVAGQAQVLEFLIKPATQAGMVRGRGVTLGDHGAMQKRLIKRLAYLDAENLRTLFELVVEAATGPARNIWPAEATVINLANDLQRCPIIEHRVVDSWLRSVEGPRAIAAGIEVELHQFLVSKRRPPGSYDYRQIRSEAAQNKRELEAITYRVSEHRASDADHRWLEAYLAARERVRRIIGQGEKKRTAA